MIDDRKYTFKCEIGSIAILWFLCNTFALFPWIANTTFFHTADQKSWDYFSLSGLRYFDFIAISIRSALSILITAIPNLWESFTID